MKGLRFLLLGLAICLASGMKAQIYNSEVLFYVYENKKLTNPQTQLFILRFKSGECQWVNKSKEKELKNVCENLRGNINYYENHSEIWGRYGDAGVYNSGMSNAKWTVYSHPFEAMYLEGVDEWPAHTMYHAFKKDFSECMKWCEPEYDNSQGHFGERKTLKRLTKTELMKMTFTGAREFLQ